MMIKEYSLKKDGDKFISENFKIKEFACKDNSDKILIDLSLVETLQKMREHFNRPIIITSGYRTDSYNKLCGGANNSYHKLGMAFDIYCKSVSATELATWLYKNGVRGIGLYTNRPLEFVHMDSRENKYYWKNNGGGNKQVSNFESL